MPVGDSYDDMPSTADERYADKIKYSEMISEDWRKWREEKAFEERLKNGRY